MSHREADEDKITLKLINSKPSGRAKNFLIWQYMKQDITPEQADKAYEQVVGHQHSIYKIYIQKTQNEDLQEKIECQNRADLHDIKEYECLKTAFSQYKLLKLTSDQRKELLPRLNSKSSKEQLCIIDEPCSIDAYKKYTPDTILSFFNLSRDFRRKNLNIQMDKEFINYLGGSWRISSFVKSVVNDKELYELQKSLLYLNGESLNSQTNFLLALNSLMHDKKNIAVEYLRLSYEKAKYRINKDKNLFWLYQITKDKKFLEYLLASKDINIYTLYANELEKKEVKNYFTTLDTGIFDSFQDLSDPFSWCSIKKQIKATSDDKLFELADNYSQENMIPVQTFILERAYDYKVHGFIMPYDKYLKGLSNDKKAFIYALMRQESNFIPSAISRSFALGLMQLMPFLVDHLSKELKEEVKYKDMFLPENNIKYSLKHLEWMEKSLYHPLFMAYAYNGGMGFLKRHLLNTGRFSQGEYEPYLSMELMENTQSREYGKKVLANYVMYKKILGDDISIINLFDKLTDPKETDRFRK
jgi:soluble lytic murein transglycosylase